MGALPRHLVAGTDLSRGSASAVRLAIAWARLATARLRVVHATGDTLGVRLDAQALESFIHDDLEPLHVGDLADAASIAVVEGDPAAALRREAEASDAVWIVVGAEGTSATLLRRAGRVPEGLAATTRHPLLVAPPRWGSRRFATRGWQSRTRSTCRRQGTIPLARRPRCATPRSPRPSPRGGGWPGS